MTLRGQLLDKGQEESVSMWIQKYQHKSAVESVWNVTKQISWSGDNEWSGIKNSVFQRFLFIYLFF